MSIAQMVADSKDIIVDEEFPVELAMLLDSRMGLGYFDIVTNNYKMDFKDGKVKSRNVFTAYWRAVFDALIADEDYWKTAHIVVNRCGVHGSLTNVPDSVIIDVAQFFFGASVEEESIKLTGTTITIKGYQAW